jgi:hypothetical protein
VVAALPPQKNVFAWGFVVVVNNIPDSDSVLSVATEGARAASGQRMEDGRGRAWRGRSPRGRRVGRRRSSAAGRAESRRSHACRVSTRGDYENGRHPTTRNNRGSFRLAVRVARMTLPLCVRNIVHPGIFRADSSSESGRFSAKLTQDDSRWQDSSGSEATFDDRNQEAGD